jgi:hypothetical protein
MESKPQNNRPLLTTLTNEPFQLIRLYYQIPSRAEIIQKLKTLECMAEDPAKECWDWLYHGEMVELRFAMACYNDIPVERRPIILGRIRFPKSGGMTLQTNSFERAVHAARFFASRLGPGVVLLRQRVVNRFFAADEGTTDEIMKHLDRDVTVVDPRSAEGQLEKDFKGVRTMEDAERAAKRSLERDLKSGRDVPLVEDFPLAPEEETPDFKHLETGLNFRFMRAFEHWKGNTHLTLTAIIVRAVKERMAAFNQSTKAPSSEKGDT